MAGAEGQAVLRDAGQGRVRRSTVLRRSRIWTGAQCRALSESVGVTRGGCRAVYSILIGTHRSQSYVSQSDPMHYVRSEERNSRSIGIAPQQDDGSPCRSGCDLGLPPKPGLIGQLRSTSGKCGQ